MSDSSPSSTSPRLHIEESHEISTLGELMMEEGKRLLSEERKPMLTPPEDGKSASRSTPEVTPKPATPKPFVQPTSFSEWQLLAVLQRANLVQYYDMFISQGGDDINQIMQCDEHEFLEIMSLVGMLTKPLHVRRLQRALTEFSKDQASFNLAAIQQIGPPPPTPQFPLVNSDPMSYLMPEMAGLAATLNSLTSSAASSTSQNGETTSPATVTAAHNSRSNSPAPQAMLSSLLWPLLAQSTSEDSSCTSTVMPPQKRKRGRPVLF